MADNEERTPVLQNITYHSCVDFTVILGGKEIRFIPPSRDIDGLKPNHQREYKWESRLDVQIEGLTAEELTKRVRGALGILHAEGTDYDDLKFALSTHWQALCGVCKPGTDQRIKVLITQHIPF